MKIRCYHCGNFFEERDGVYVERRISKPDVIPAEHELTGFGYCSRECAESHYIPEQANEFRTLGNYEETDTSVVISSPDGGVRGEVLRIRELRETLAQRSISSAESSCANVCWCCFPLCVMMAT